MDSKLIGSILLVVGTSIGGGMLALPIATAQLGFVGALILLIACWFVMTVGAFLILEVNLWLAQNNNVISMARVTIGPVGQIIAWLTYLLLLYSLLCAYISGGSDLFHYLLTTKYFSIPVWGSTLLFTFLFGGFVYLGIRSVDYLNRGLMFFKLGAYFLLVIFLLPFISVDKLTVFYLENMSNSTAITVTITSFGFAVIVPSLRIYLSGQLQKLKWVILIGSLIPLICYIVWVAAIMGVIPLTGDQGLKTILQSTNSTSTLVATLSAITQTPAVSLFAKLFTSVCVLTSFLSVALCLTDFLADGFQLEKKGLSGLFIHIITFLPPLIIVLFFPNIFIQALKYAGIYCIILLILLPACMTWLGRYHRGFKSQFKIPGGKWLLIILMAFGFFVIFESLFG